MGVLIFLALSVYLCSSEMWFISPSKTFSSVCWNFCYLFFASVPPISQQRSLKFHLSPRLCLVVINSQWTEHGDGSAQYFCTPHTLTKAEKSIRFMFSLWIFHLLQSAISLRYISLNHLLYNKEHVETLVLLYFLRQTHSWSLLVLLRARCRL